MFKNTSYTSGVVVSTSLNVFSKLLAFINTLLIAYYFGVNAETDIYFYIIVVANLLSGIINGIDLLVLVPEILRLRERESEVKARQFVNFFIYLYFAISLTLVLIIFISPTNFYGFVSKFDIGKLNSRISMLNIGAGIIFFQICNSFLTSVLTAYRFFTAPMLAGIINGSFAITFTFFFHDKIGIDASLIGIFIGFLVNFFLLLLMMIVKLKWNFLDFVFLRNIAVWKNIALMQFNLLPIWLRNFISILMLSDMQSGTMTGFNLAQNIAVVPELFITAQVISIAGIKFSELTASNDFVRLKSLFSSLLIGLLIVILPIAIVFNICSYDIVTIVFFKGNMQSNSLAITATCLFYFSILLPFKIPDSLFTRLFTSMQLYKETVFFGFIAHIIIAGLTYTLASYFGVHGYFSALLIGYCLVMPVTFYLILHLKARMLMSAEMLNNLTRLLLVTIALSAIAYIGHSFLNFPPIINVLFIAFGISIPFLLVSNLVLDIKPLKTALNVFFLKLKKY